MYAYVYVYIYVCGYTQIELLKRSAEEHSIDSCLDTGLWKVPTLNDLAEAR